MQFHNQPFGFTSEKNPMIKTPFIQNYDFGNIVPGTGKFLITEDGKFITTEDGKFITTE